MAWLLREGKKETATAIFNALSAERQWGLMDELRDQSLVDLPDEDGRAMAAALKRYLRTLSMKSMPAEE
jgi:hypothetical protein